MTNNIYKILSYFFILFIIIITTTNPIEIEGKKLEYKKVKFVAAGDNLIHDHILDDTKIKTNLFEDLSNDDILKHLTKHEYDFDALYEETEDIIKHADLAYVNQETVVNSLYPTNGFPRFSTPIELGNKIINLGFDVIGLANNHILDVNSDGLKNSLKYWNSKSVTTFGIYENKKDLENVTLIEKNGITFAFIGLTQYSNRLKLPKTSSMKLLYLGKDNKTIKKQILQADQLADVVVVTPHFGQEVSDEVQNYQRKHAKKYIEWGADIIIGTQPHTIQPIELIKKDNGEQALIYYSLGNYAASMTTSYPLSSLGMIGSFEVIKDDNNNITFKDIKGIPIINHFEKDKRNNKIYLYENYSEKLVSKHWGNQKNEVTKAFYDKQIKKILKQYLHTTT